MKGKRKQRKLRGGSDARQLVTALKAAGIPSGNIRTTAEGHLQVTCPGGVVILPSDVSDSRTYANNRRTLAAHGVVIPARGGWSGGSVRQRNHHARRRGTVTRYRTGETYALVTDMTGETWFVSRTGLPSSVADQMAYGREVTFTGSPVPEPWKPYPQAAEIRLVLRQEERERSA